ncbi:unnamed protein product [Sympodiomycopsis kandeliae]
MSAAETPSSRSTQTSHEASSPTSSTRPPSQPHTDVEKQASDVPSSSSTVTGERPQTEQAPQYHHAKDEQEKKDVIWVEFERGDPTNPFNFSNARKWTITMSAVFFTAEVAATAATYVPGIPQMEMDLGVTNHTVGLLGISIYALGFGFPPLVLAPFSEVFGRRNVFLVSHAVFTLFFLCCGFAQNITTVIIGRFIQGAAGSTGSTLVSGVISDLWDKSVDRGTPMAMFGCAAIFGTGIGPVWAGWVVQRSDLGWRWVQYIQAIFTGGGMLILALCLVETRGSVLLTWRAAKLRKETGDERYKAKAEEERSSLWIVISQSLTRPIWLLFTEPIVFFFGMWVSLMWLMLYATLESIGLVSDLHGYSIGQSGLVFLAVCLGALIGFGSNFYQEKLYKQYYPIKGPEARLYAPMVSAFLFPIGCFIYGWTAYSYVSIAGPIVGLVLIMIAVFHVYLAVFNYLADAYLIFASSAIAAQSFLRNLLGGFAAPLFTTPMYKQLGYQWASSLIGFLSIVFGVIPFVLFKHGPKIRARSKFSEQLQELERKHSLQDNPAQANQDPSQDKNKS